VFFTLYTLLLYLAAPFYFPFMAVKMALKGKGRAGIGQRLGFYDGGFKLAGGGSSVWVHAVSVGETLAAVPIVKALKERHPGVRVYFSTVTETGNKVAKENLSDDERIFFFPFDFPGVVGRAIDAIRPDVFVVVETEIWPNLLHALSKRGIPSVMVNGRISRRSYRRYMWVKFLMGPVLALFSRMNMQTASDAERIKDMGAPPDRVGVTGNVKFDHACSALKEGGKDVHTRARLGIPDNAVVVIAGSTHAGEEEQVLTAYRRILESYPDAFLILAPRHPERNSEVGALLDRAGVKYKLKSSLTGGRLTGPGVILLDTMGELAGLYRVGDINFVGGSWAQVGGHNVLEPVAFGKPVFFGPVMHNFAEIGSMLRDCGVGIEVKDGLELAKEAVRLLQEPERLDTLAKTAREALLKNRGALGRNVSLIEGYLKG